MTMLFCGVAHAAPPKDELAKTRSAMEQAKTRAAELAQQAKTVEAELPALQQQLVEFAQAMQQSEAAVFEVEEKLRALSEQVQSKSAALAASKKHLGALVQVALRLSRTPQEAVVLMPGDSEQAMKASRALAMTSAGIKEEIHAISLQMAELRALEEKVAKHRDQLAAGLADLSAKRKDVEVKLVRRKALQQKFGRQAQQEKQTIEQLAKKAAGLEELLVSLETVRKQGNEKSRGWSVRKKGKLRSFEEARGSLDWPVAGRLVQPFGKSRAKNETSKGWTLRSRPAAQVLAPYDGEVVFTGPFLNYGKLVILRHSDDFHTLLAGLDHIDVRQGEFLLEGEPIGAMAEDESKNRLYLELRKNNQPVDPAQYLKNSL
jgi:septal ring factor EnvC (AmiA/AmiB activator)